MKLDYFTIPELPNKPMFRCERRSASLQAANCARMWNDANGPKATQLTSPCKNCNIGAHHAGVDNASQSPITGSPICARCERTGLRMVGNHICVSCWNREREYLIGKNRRGVKPKHHPTLHRMAIRFLCDSEVRTISIPTAATLKELVISCLRDNRKTVVFGMARGMNGPV